MGWTTAGGRGRHLFTMTVQAEELLTASDGASRDVAHDRHSPIVYRNRYYVRTLHCIGIVVHY